jgi:hypothetical protein
MSHTNESTDTDWEKDREDLRDILLEIITEASE